MPCTALDYFDKDQLIYDTLRNYHTTNDIEYTFIALKDSFNFYNLVNNLYDPTMTLDVPSNDKNSHCSYVKFVWYEEMQHDFDQYLSEMEKFLNCPLSDDQRAELKVRTKIGNMRKAAMDSTGRP